MAVTQLSDLNIVDEIFTAAVMQRTLATNRFIASGVAVRDSTLDAFLNGDVGGKTFNPRYLGALADTDPNISSDSPTAKSTPDKITSLLNTAVRQSLNKSWSSMDLSADLLGIDPIGAITAQIADYWNTVIQKRTLFSLTGIIAGNIADNAGDMVINISAGAGAAALFNAESFIDAQTTMGDMQEGLTAIAVHSNVLATMRKMDLIEYIKDSESTKPIAYYGTLPIIVDDGMTTIGEGAAKVYYTYLFGAGAIALGFGSPKVPFEVDRAPDAGNGGGQETIYSRQELIIHPQGFKYALQTTPTTAELKLATSWDRAFERKRVPLACLITKG